MEILNEQSEKLTTDELKRIKCKECLSFITFEKANVSFGICFEDQKIHDRNEKCLYPLSSIKKGV